jgi:hypothetical protein
LTEKAKTVQAGEGRIAPGERRALNPRAYRERYIPSEKTSHGKTKLFPSRLGGGEAIPRP